MADYHVGDSVFCYNMLEELDTFLVNKHGYAPFTVGKTYRIRSVKDDKSFYVYDNQHCLWRIVPNLPWKPTNIMIHEIFKLKKQ